MFQSELVSDSFQITIQETSPQSRHFFGIPSGKSLVGLFYFSQ